MRRAWVLIVAAAAAGCDQPSVPSPPRADPWERTAAAAGRSFADFAAEFHARTKADLEAGRPLDGVPAGPAGGDPFGPPQPGRWRVNGDPQPIVYRSPSPAYEAEGAVTVNAWAVAGEWVTVPDEVRRVTFRFGLRGGRWVPLGWEGKAGKFDYAAVKK